MKQYLSTLNPGTKKGIQIIECIVGKDSCPFCNRPINYVPFSNFKNRKMDCCGAEFEVWVTQDKKTLLRFKKEIEWINRKFQWG